MPNQTEASSNNNIFVVPEPGKPKRRWQKEKKSRPIEAVSSKIRIHTNGKGVNTDEEPIETDYSLVVVTDYNIKSWYPGQSLGL